MHYYTQESAKGRERKLPNRAGLGEVPAAARIAAWISVRPSNACSRFFSSSFEAIVKFETRNSTVEVGRGRVLPDWRAETLTIGRYCTMMSTPADDEDQY